MTRQSRFLSIPLLIGVLLLSGFSNSSGQSPDDNSIFLPMVFRDYDPTWQPGQPELVTLTPTPLGDPHLTIDLQGRLHILWNPWSGSNAFIYHTYQTDAGWTPAEPVAQTLGTSTMVTNPVTGPDGSIHLIWKNDLNFGGPYRLMYAVWKNGVWSAEVELHRTTYNGIDGQVEVDSSGHPHVLITSVDDIIRMSYYHCIPGAGGCVEKTKLPAKHLTHDMFLDRNGGVVILGNGSTLFTQMLYYSYWFNGSLFVDSVSIGGDVNYRPGIIDSDRNILFVRSASVPIPGGNVYGLYTQCLTSNRVWRSESVLTGNTSIGSYLFTHSPSLKVVSVWEGSSDGKLHFERWSNCVAEKKNEVRQPSVGAKNWGDLVALARSDQPKKVCVLGSVPYYGNEFIAYCVDLNE